MNLNVDLAFLNFSIGLRGELITSLNNHNTAEVLGNLISLKELKVYNILVPYGTEMVIPFPIVCTKKNIAISEELHKIAPKESLNFNTFNITDIELQDSNLVKYIYTLGLKYKELGKLNNFGLYKEILWQHNGDNREIYSILNSIIQATQASYKLRTKQEEKFAKQKALEEEIKDKVKEPIQEEPVQEEVAVELTQEEPIQEEPIQEGEEVVAEEPTQEGEEEVVAEEPTQEEPTQEEEVEEEEQPTPTTPEITETSDKNFTWSGNESSTKVTEDFGTTIEEEDSSNLEEELLDSNELIAELEKEKNILDDLAGFFQLNDYSKEEYEQTKDEVFVKMPIYKTEQPYAKTNMVGRPLAIRRPEDQTVMRFVGASFESVKEVTQVFYNLEENNYELSLLEPAERNKLLTLWLYFCKPILNETDIQNIIDLDIPFKVFVDYYSSTANNHAYYFLSQYITLEKVTTIGLYEGLYWRQILRLYSATLYRNNKRVSPDIVRDVEGQIVRKLVDNIIKKVSDDVKFNIEFDKVFEYDDDLEDGSSDSMKISNEEIAYHITTEEYRLAQMKSTFDFSVSTLIRAIILNLQQTYKIPTVLDALRFLQVNSIEVRTMENGEKSFFKTYVPVSFASKHILGLPDEDILLHVNEFGILMVFDKKLEIPMCAELCAFCYEEGLTTINSRLKKEGKKSFDIDYEKDIIAKRNLSYNLALQALRKNEIFEKYITDEHKPILSIKDMVLKPLKYVTLSTNSREFIHRVIKATGKANTNIQNSVPTFILCEIINEEGKDNMKNKLIDHVLLPIRSESLVSLAGKLTFAENGEMVVNYKLYEIPTKENPKASAIAYPFTKETIENNPDKNFFASLDKETFLNYKKIRQLRALLDPNTPRKEGSPEPDREKAMLYAGYLLRVNVSYDEIAKKHDLGKFSMFNSVLNTIKENPTLFSNPALAPIDYPEFIKGNAKDLMEIERETLRNFVYNRDQKLAKLQQK